MPDIDMEYRSIYTRNVYACLVHENRDCVRDLVDNLTSVDPESTILLYNGGVDRDLLSGRLSGNGAKPLIHPSPRRLRWGALHPFALDCMEFALETLEFDTLTVVDSDQLATRPGYVDCIGAFLRRRPEVGLLGCSAGPEPRHRPRGPAAAAFRELDLWRPFLSQFEAGESKFPIWTFWPGTVFTVGAARDLVAFTRRDRQLDLLLRKSRIWATEEVLLPSLVGLLGHEVAVNPCDQEFVKYKVSYTLDQVQKALGHPEVFWLHPVPRVYGDRTRTLVRERVARGRNRPHGNGARRSSGSSQAPIARPLLLTRPILREAHGIEGWLSDEEAELLIAATVQALTTVDRPGAIVEVGSFCGRGTVVLARVAAALQSSPRVYAIDPHDGLIGARDRGIERVAPTLPRFKANISKSGLADIVISIPKSAPEATWEGPVSLLVVDHLHDYTSVKRDFQQFESWLQNGALIAFHDYADYFPGVVAFVDELLDGGGYESVHWVDTMHVLRRTPEARARLPRRDRPSETRRQTAPRRAGHRQAGRPVQDVQAPDPDRPMVSCLMPTYNRREFVPRAIDCFLNQDYSNRELIVIDDGTDPIEDVLPPDPRIRVVRLESRQTIGAKRNAGADVAAGELLANWDDDDWYAPWRLTYQVEQLRSAAVDLCGLNRLLYVDPRRRQAWRYAAPPMVRKWLADGTLLFTRELWHRNPFPDVSMAIDTRFLWTSQPKRLLALEREDIFVGVIHQANTSPKDIRHSVWRPIAFDELPELVRRRSCDGADTLVATARSASR